MKSSPVGRSGERDGGDRSVDPDHKSHGASGNAGARRATSHEPSETESANAVLDALSHWRTQMAKSIEAITADPGQAGTKQTVALLNSQRQVLEQVKASLTELQRMIEAFETGLKRQGETGAAMSLPALFSGFMPQVAAAFPSPLQGAMGPMTAPMTTQMTAMWSMQKAALSSVGVWAKAAHDCHGMWLGALEAMVPGDRGANGSGNREDGRSPGRDRRQE